MAEPQDSGAPEHLTPESIYDYTPAQATERLDARCWLDGGEVVRPHTRRECGRWGDLEAIEKSGKGADAP